MKKVTAGLLIAVMLLTVTAPMVQAEGRGGLMGFIAGCCFGIRAGGDYNAGKEIHWREWIMLVPIANLVFSVWNGIEGMEGVTRSEYAARYGASFY